MRGMTQTDADPQTQDGWTGPLLAAVTGAVALGAGLIAGLTPVSTSGGSCGSVFGPSLPSGGGLASNLVRIWCEEDLASRAGLTWTLLVVGIVLLVIGIVWFGRRHGRTVEAVVAAPVSGDLADQLRHLAAMHHDGTLSDDEFTAAKARLLG